MSHEKPLKRSSAGSGRRAGAKAKSAGSDVSESSSSSETSETSSSQASSSQSSAGQSSAVAPPLPSLVAVIMGSASDWETMRVADEVLTEFEVPHECLIVSAHRTPQWMCEFAATAEARGLEVIIAGAGGAAHLPGMVAAQTTLPVLGVPVESRALKGLDSLLSIVQMPGGVPVGTLAIGAAGAKNAALLALSILANKRPELRERLHSFRQRQEREAREARLS